MSLLLLPLDSPHYFWRLLSLLLLFYALYFIVILVWPIIFPTVITYPWEEDKRAQQQQHGNEENDSVIAIMAGSFSPPQRGHHAMIEYLSKRHKRVICVVGKNPNKQYAVLPEERAELVKTMMSSSSNVTVEVVSDYIWRYAKRNFPKHKIVFYRGIRSWEKDGAEERTLQILNTWGPLLYGWTRPIPTIYLTGQPEYNHISSTLIRNIILEKDEGDDATTIKKEALARLVLPSTVDRIYQLYSKNLQTTTTTKDKEK